MKRSTLILMILAVALGTAVYYLEYKPGKPRDEETASTSKPAWEIKSEEIASIEIRRNVETVVLKAEGEKWVMSQPLTAPANDSAVQSLLSDLTGLTIEREFPTTNPEELKSYGLAAPGLRIEIKLKNGQSKVVELGEKDVLGASSYARIDGGSNIAMVGTSLLTSAGKTVSEFRDRTLLGGNATDLVGISVVKGSVSFEITQRDGTWSFVRPSTADTDESEISSYLSTLTSAEAKEIVSETTNGANYGLASPQLAVTTRLAAGGERTISIGAKEGEDYYARVSDKPQIFRISSSTYDQLNATSVKLKSKTLVRFNREELQSIKIRNANMTLLAERGGDGKWVIKEPSDKKGQEASTFQVVDPFETRASEVIEKPSPSILALFAKPVIEARLTDNSGKVTTVRFTAARDGSAYVRVDGRPDVYKVPDSVVETLGFKADQIGDLPK